MNLVSLTIHYEYTLLFNLVAVQLAPGCLLTRSQLHLCRIVLYDPLLPCLSPSLVGCDSFHDFYLVSVLINFCRPHGVSAIFGKLEVLFCTF